MIGVYNYIKPSGLLPQKEKFNNVKVKTIERIQWM